MGQAEIYEILKEHEGEKLTISQIMVLYKQKYGRPIPKSAASIQLRKLWLSDMSVQCERIKDKGRIHLVYWYEER